MTVVSDDSSAASESILAVWQKICQATYQDR